ncbi:hypothetical protein BJ138DRAFT_1020477, partial [Hygrophoropsis aurantiaca]
MGCRRPAALEPIVDDTSEPSISASLLDIELIDLFTRKRASLPSLQSHVYANETLIHHGYLGSAPLFPTVAISIRTLAAYCQVHRTCPRFTIQAQCKALCHLHHVPYRPHLSAQLSAAYDIYLEIIYRVEHQLKVALQHDTPNWCLLNSCPPCFYKLKNEPHLDIAYLTTMDGNNSLKRWASWMYGTTPQGRGEGKIGTTLMFILIQQITVNPCQTKEPIDDAYQDDWQDIDPTDPFDCVKRWRNTGPEHRKRMFSAFNETGIFISACRHRCILLACNMIRSGELPKYPLAVVDRLLSVYGQGGGCAYDIGCAFSKT